MQQTKWPKAFQRRSLPPGWPRGPALGKHTASSSDPSEVPVLGWRDTQCSMRSLSLPRLCVGVCVGLRPGTAFSPSTEDLGGGH